MTELLKLFGGRSPADWETVKIVRYGDPAIGRWDFVELFHRYPFYSGGEYYGLHTQSLGRIYAGASIVDAEDNTLFFRPALLASPLPETWGQVKEALRKCFVAD